jgi:tetratricopeptide (TPR) repeat protein
VLDSAEAAVQTTNDPLAHLSANLARARWYLAAGQAEAAYQSTQGLLELLEASGLHPFKNLGLYYQGRALQSLGRFEEAITVLESAERYAEQTSRKIALWEIQSLLAQLFRERGDEAKARTLEEKARANALFMAQHAPTDLRPVFLNQPHVRVLFRGPA